MAPKLTEDQIRALNPQQLLSYALQLNTSKRKSDQISQPTHTQQTVQPQARPDEPNVTKKKKQKQFDMSRYGQRLIALKLTYQGWQYHGFASQPTSQNTVEHHLFAALQKTRLIVSRETCAYTRAGRTDVGVSAMGQVIGIRMRSNVVPPSSAVQELNYVKILNGVLPEGIRILAWSPVSDASSLYPKIYPGDPEPIRTYWSQMQSSSTKLPTSVRRSDAPFSARFDALHRSYKYFFPRGQLNIKLMREAAAHFVGRHDFRNFCRIDENVTNFERLMYEVDIRSVHAAPTENDDEYTMYYIFVKGQAFLWHQVRCMASVLFDIGMGNERPSLVQRMLEDASKASGTFSKGRPQYKLASPIPLLLFDCSYPDSVVYFPHIFETGQEDGNMRRIGFQRVDADITKCYVEAATKATIISEVLKENDSLSNFTVSEGKSKRFGEVRMARNFLLHDCPSRHIPYEQRDCDDPVEMKLERAAKKKRTKELPSM